MSAEIEIIRQRAQIQITSSVHEISGHLQECLDCGETAPSPIDVVDHLVTCRTQFAEDVLWLLDELQPSTEWHVFDWDNPTTWPRKVGRYIVATAWPDEDKIDRDWDRDTWWCYFGADKPPVGHWQEFQSEAVTHWMPIQVPEPPAPVSKEED